MYFGLVPETLFRAPDSCGYKISESVPCCSPDFWNWQGVFSRELCCSRQRQSGHSGHCHDFGLTLLTRAVLWGGPQACSVAMVLSSDPDPWLLWLPSAQPQTACSGAMNLCLRGEGCRWPLATHAPALTQCPLPPNPRKMFGCSSLSPVCMVKGLLLKHFSQLETFIGLSFMLKKSWQP